ncbi:MAG: undecaprenyl-diphosphate phosphatase [Deltaproteobacteria bacterium]|nr:undecaprenyl-diphosphate phosphatase [Deltaproteobacteria bacterium]
MVGVLVLGLIQGLTEFLPVSSSGHLALGSELFGLHPPSLLLDVMLHVGTLVPVLIFYRDDVVDAFRSLRLLGNPRAHWSESAGLRLTVCVVVGSIPTAIIGVLAAEQISLWLSNLKTVCIAFFVTGGVLLLTLVRRRFVADPETGFRTLTIGKALAIGFAQGLAITPGVSRSGSTIATSLLLNVERQMAARFSFLLSVPAIVGAAALTAKRADFYAADLTKFAAGAAVAGISGYLALLVVTRFVKQGRMHWFALYMIPLAMGLYLYATSQRIW